MTIEPTEADKAAAEAIYAYYVRQSFNDDPVWRHNIASVISQNMAPERSAAAAVKAELEEANRRVRVLAERLHEIEEVFIDGDLIRWSGSGEKI